MKSGVLFEKINALPEVLTFNIKFYLYDSLEDLLEFINLEIQ